ncbi:MAG: CsbD family protein [Burkholderiales bacterium]|nr:CsbD family protein [Burkholderiales bacterium]
MNRDRIAGNLKQLGGTLRQQWGRLTHDENAVNAGKCTQLAGTIQARHGQSKEEAERQLREFLDRNRDWNLSSH